MPKLTIIYWRDIPAQVIGQQGRKRFKLELPRRFAEAIDRAAMRAGKGSSDLYLEEWRRERRRQRLQRLADLPLDGRARLLPPGGRAWAAGGQASVDYGQLVFVPHRFGPIWTPPETWVALPRKTFRA